VVISGPTILNSMIHMRKEIIFRHLITEELFFIRLQVSLEASNTCEKSIFQ
jgi:hypothetical protein